MKKYFTKIKIASLLLLSQVAFGQNLPGDSLVFGPMFSPVYNDTVRVWVMTKSGTGSGKSLKIEMKLNSGGPIMNGTLFNSDTRWGYNVISYVYPGLQQGNKYKAEVLSNGTSINKFSVITSSQNQINDFEFLSGGCGRIYDPSRCVDRYEMQSHINGTTKVFKKMASEHSDLMVWLGDATYLLGIEHAGGTCPGMINDWDTENALFKRYFFYRAFHDDLLRSMPQLAITDNHDTGGNEFNMTMPTLGISRSTFMRWWPNPTYNRTSQGQGLFSTYKYKDIEFFMLDNRSYRMSISQQLGNEQLNWLKQALAKSTATYKILISGTPFVEKNFFRAFSLTAEAISLIAFIKAHNINGVMCYSADWHNVFLNGNYDLHSYPFFDILDGKLNSDAGGNVDTTLYITPGNDKIFSYSGQIYLRTNVYGPVGNRRFKIEYVSPAGLVKYSTIIYEDMLKSIDNDTRKIQLSFSNSLFDSSLYHHTVQASNIAYCNDRKNSPLSAVEFNTTSSASILFTDQLEMHDRTFSITYWTKPYVYPGNYAAIFSNSNGTNGYSIGMDNSGHPLFINHANGQKYTGSYILNINRWTHVVWKYDNVKLQLYLYADGNLMNKWNNVKNLVPASANLTMGTNYANAHYNGALDEFNLYGKLITIQTIIDITKVKEYEANKDFSVFPNPAKEIINIQYDISAGNGEGIATLYDLSGKVMKEIVLPKNAKSLAVPVANIPLGMYFISIKANGYQLAPQKIVLQNWKAE